MLTWTRIAVPPPAPAPKRMWTRQEHQWPSTLHKTDLQTKIFSVQDQRGIHHPRLLFWHMTPLATWELYLSLVLIFSLMVSSLGVCLRQPHTSRIIKMSSHIFSIFSNFYDYLIKHCNSCVCAMWTWSDDQLIHTILSPTDSKMPPCPQAKFKFCYRDEYKHAYTHDSACSAHVWVCAWNKTTWF